MSQGTRIKAHITGGPPWGFRLQGGGSGNTPVAIAKIRRKSKAFNARLQEGDEIVSVNGRNCQNVSRDVTMSYVDGAKESLDLEVIRRDKNFNTVNASTYNISNNNPNITTGKPATIQLMPSGTFQPPVRPGSVGGTVRQTTKVQSRIIPVENRSQTQQTITRTVTQKVGDEDAKTSTTTEVKTFGSDGQETTNRVINTGGPPQQKPVVFQPKIVGNAKPSGWSPSQQPQQPKVVRVGQKTTINLQGSFDEEPEQPPKPSWTPISQPKPVQPAWTPSSQPSKPPQPSWTPQQQQQQQQQQQPSRPQQHTWSPGTHAQQRQPEPVRPGQQATFHFQGNYNEPPKEAPKDLASLIPSQSTTTNSKPSLRPSLAKPQSVSPIRYAPSSTHAPVSQEETKRWSAPARSNVGKEMTITFGGPGQGMKIPIGVAAPMSMAQPAPSQQSTVTKYSTRTVTTLEETKMDQEESSEDEPEVFRTPSPRIPVPPPQPQPEKPVNIMDDPSLILRGLYKPPGAKETKKKKMLRPKSYPGCMLEPEPDLDETDKMKVCKNIADLLMFPKNKGARGAKMFAKQRKRSAKYTIEAYGIRGEDEELPQQIGPKVPIPRRLDEGSDSPIRTPKPPPAPAPPPPPPISTEPIFIPSLGISIKPTDFSITKKKEEKCEHKTVSPMQCGMLVADLKGASGRGASMFERRRKRSDKFILTTEGQNPDAAPVSPEDKENEQPKQVTLEFIARHGSEEVEEPPPPQPRQATPIVLMKSPWEAAAESPVGSIDSAFNHMSKKGFTGVDSPPQPQTDRPKPPAEWMKTSSMLPQIPAKPPIEPKIKPKFKAGLPTLGENGHAPPQPLFKPKFDARKQQNQNQKNFQDFNIKARGWGGGSPRQSPEDTPPSASPASVHSGEFAGGSPGLAASLPTQPLKYGGGYNNFNKKPRSFPPSGGFSPAEPMEGDEL